MGVLYSVFRLGEHEEMASWLRSFGIACPPGHSRYPTVDELRHVLDQLEGYATEYSIDRLGHWYASVYGPHDAHAFLVVPDYHGADDRPHAFHFEKGSKEVNLLILKQLAEICGPLVIVPDTGSDPIVVTPDLDIDQAIQVWYV